MVQRKLHEGGGNAITWTQADDVIRATQGLQGRNLPRAAAAHGTASMNHSYARKRKFPRKTVAVAQDTNEEDDSEDQHQHGESDSTIAMENEESVNTVNGSAPTGDGLGGFHLNDD